MGREGLMVLAALLAAVLWSTPARAVVERECIVSVRVAEGWSAENKRKLHFVTGLELARLIRVMKVDFHQYYAVIWHGSGLPTVVKLSGTLLGVKQEFTAADFSRLFEHVSEREATQIEGEGRGLTWRIRTTATEGEMAANRNPISVSSR